MPPAEADSRKRQSLKKVCTMKKKMNSRVLRSASGAFYKLKSEHRVDQAALAPKCISGPEPTPRKYLLIRAVHRVRWDPKKPGTLQNLDLLFIRGFQIFARKINTRMLRSVCSVPETTRVIDFLILIFLMFIQKPDPVFQGCLPFRRELHMEIHICNAHDYGVYLKSLKLKRSRMASPLTFRLRHCLTLHTKKLFFVRKKRKLTKAIPGDRRSDGAFL